MRGTTEWEDESGATGENLPAVGWQGGGMDVVGPAGHALPAEVEPLLARIADEAFDVDRQGVRRERLDDLAALGLLGSPLEPVDAQRELAERLAMADASTWFCWTQHQTPLRILEGSAAGLREPASALLRDRHLEDMRSGRQLAAVAFAHVRRPGPPNPVAHRVDGGWVLNGTLDWVTSWDIADVVMVMAQGSGDDTDTLVCAYLPAGRSADRVKGIRVEDPLHLLAMSGTHTRPLRLDSVEVPDASTVLIDRGTWLGADAVTTANATPAVFGVIRGALAELDDIATARSDDVVRAAADALAGRCRTLRQQAYRGIDEGDPVDVRVGLRVESLDLAMTAATSVVTARSGAAMARGTSAERRLREASFLQVQAQTAVIRRESLRRLINREP